MEGDLIVEKKFRIFHRWLWLLELVPYSRKFFVVGSVARGTAREESDIDLWVVAKANRVWLNRTLLNFVLLIIGKRRTRRHHADRICLNVSLSGNYYFQPSLVTRLRSLFEWFCEITFLGPILERLARKFLKAYIKMRFHDFKQDLDTILILENKRIIYYPPRKSRYRPIMWKSGGLTVIDRWVY